MGYDKWREAVLPDLLPEVHDALEMGRDVIVHCLGGRHRGAMGWILLMMYLMGETMEHWTEELRSKRPFIDPEGFLERKKQYGTYYMFENHTHYALSLIHI